MCQATVEMSGDRKRCQEPLSVSTHTPDSERGASDFRTGFAPVGPFVHLSSLPSIQEMVPDTFISSHPIVSYYSCRYRLMLPMNVEAQGPQA